MRVVSLVSVGLFLVVALLSGASAAAQEATPGATPSDENGALVVQLAAGGTFTVEEGDPATATLTLEGVWPETVFFTDRPERLAGTLETAATLELEGLFDADTPPNAAVVLGEADDEGADVLVVTLRDPAYDPDAGTLRYAVSVLDEVPVGLAPWADRADRSLPGTFSRVAVFIDGFSIGAIMKFKQAGGG